ncbi:hypothetical protein MRB53_041801 [Persea americana]|nr:hypothetical protein MRB53_041801 [Persea americana]
MLANFASWFPGVFASASAVVCLFRSPRLQLFSVQRADNVLAWTFRFRDDVPIMPLDFSFETPTVHDGADLARTQMSAFWQDEDWAWSRRHTTLEKIIPESSKRIPRDMLVDREIKRYQTAVDATGIIGVACWILPRHHKHAWPKAVVPAVTAEEEVEIRRVAETAEWHVGPPLSKDFDVRVNAMRKRLESKQPYFTLHYLAVRPNQQRRGVATALVKSGMIEAAKLDLDVFVLAFPVAVGVYNRLGFVVVERETLSGKSYRADEEPSEYYNSIMVCSRLRS